MRWNRCWTCWWIWTHIKLLIGTYTTPMCQVMQRALMAYCSHEFFITKIEQQLSFVVQKITTNPNFVDEKQVHSHLLLCNRILVWNSVTGQALLGQEQYPDQFPGVFIINWKLWQWDIQSYNRQLSALYSLFLASSSQTTIPLQINCQKIGLMGYLAHPDTKLRLQYSGSCIFLICWFCII